MLKNAEMPKSRLWFIVALIGLAAISRVLPHLPNATPVAAIALFAGAQLGRNALAVLVPFIAMFISDMIIGFHSGMIAVYLTFLAITALGMHLHSHFSVARLATYTLLSSVLFFLTTNFSVWLMDAMYPMDMNGLTQCYVAALPFFRNTLIGDIFYTSLLFGLMAYAQHRLPQWRAASRA